MMGKHTYVPESCKELVKALQSLSYTRSIYEVFQDWEADVLLSCGLCGAFGNPWSR